jgi:glycosyltransferase involved in cell wall biosynthesis
VELQRLGHVVHVLVFYRAGTSLEAALAKAGVPLVDLRKSGRWDLPAFLLRLRRAVRASDLDVIYSFLPTANVLAATVWGGAKRPAVVWGVRGTDVFRASNDWLGSALVVAERRLATRPTAIIANSTSAMTGCEIRGWPTTSLHLVPNGLDPEVFRFQPQRRDQLRREWNTGLKERLVGVAGRLDPVKGLEVLLKALQALGNESGNVRLLVAGEGSVAYEASLRQQALALGLGARVVWLGRVHDMAGFYSAIDVLCSPSLSEGCSNVVAESLACGTPVVATRVGDNHLLVPDPASLVDAGNSLELGRVLCRVLASIGGSDREVLRHGILGRLTLSAMATSTAAILQAAARSVNPPAVA